MKRKNILARWTGQIKLGKKQTKDSYHKQNAKYFNKGERLRIPAQFIAQPSKHVQKITSIGKPTRYILGEGITHKKYQVKAGRNIPMRLKFEKGKDLLNLLQTRESKWVSENRFEIVKELANATAELNLKFGVAHLDLDPRNIVVTKTKKGKPVVKLIDFEHAEQIEINPKKIKDLLTRDTNIMTSEFTELKGTIEALATTDKEEKELWKLFQKQYEKKAKKIL